VASEIEVKTERLQQMLEAEKLDAVLMNGRHNFAWLTGGSSNAIDISRDGGAAGIMVVRDGRRFLLANNIEQERFLNEVLSAKVFEPLEMRWQDEKASAEAVVDLARSVLPAGASIASDLPIAPSVRLVEPLISRCRYQLTNEEIVRFGRLGQDAGKALGKVASEIVPGESEQDIAQKVRIRLSELGVAAVVTLVGADERIEKYRHPVPTSNVWRNTLLIAVCARRNGLIVSLTRIVCAVKVSSELKRRTEAAAVVNASLYAATEPGTSAASLYRAAANAYAAQGFADEIDKHHQGGACGYRTRDWTAHPANNETVKLNQAFAWNPSITGTKVEETGIIGKSGFETVTGTKGFPQIGVTINGQTYFSPGILLLSKGATA